MSLDRRRLQEQIHELYRSEHEAMGERGTLERLDRAREWDLAPTLAAGVVVVFPHAASRHPPRRRSPRRRSRGVVSRGPR